MSWTIHALCPSRPDLPWDHCGDGTADAVRRGVAAAKAVRRACPSCGPCLAAADREERVVEPSGIRGGENVPERIKRRGR